MILAMLMMYHYVLCIALYISNISYIHIPTATPPSTTSPAISPSEPATAKARLRPERGQSKRARRAKTIITIN
jgi:hypothetical protein